MYRSISGVYNIVLSGILEFFSDPNFHFTPTRFRDMSETVPETSVWTEEKSEESKQRVREQHEKYFPDIGQDPEHDIVFDSLDKLANNSEYAHQNIVRLTGCVEDLYQTVEEERKRLTDLVDTINSVNKETREEYNTRLEAIEKQLEQSKVHAHEEFKKICTLISDMEHNFNIHMKRIEKTADEA